jgi:tetratricopeptide (TPR) repeat protein
MEFNPEFALFNWAEVLGEKGLHDEQLAIYRRAYASDAELSAALEDGFEKAGNKGAYRALADLMAAWYGKPGKRVFVIDISIHYLDAGDYDLAIDWLERAYEDHDPDLPYIGQPIYDPIRSNPRFQDLLRKMNLPTGRN